MPTLLTPWAKLGDHTWPDQYHPLICHLIDVGCVAEALWKRVIRDRVKSWVTKSLGLPNHDATGRWLAFWIGAHDIGKACRCFQIRGDDSRMRKLLDELPEPEWNQPGIIEAHSYVSTAILKKSLAKGWGWPAIDKKTANFVAVTVGGHHGLFPPSLDKANSAIGNAKWQGLQRELLVKLAELLELSTLPAPKSTGDPKDQATWMYFAGLTSVADWVGSNKEYFPEEVTPSRRPESIDLDEYFSRSRRTSVVALEQLGWLGRAEDNTPRTFSQLFGIQTPRPLQTRIEELASTMTEPALFIVEAPMGEGKTEAAWYVADRWDRRGGQGSYVALPTMATSNQMFDRVEKFLQARAGKSNVQLLHGKAQLSDLFDRLKYAAEIYDESKNPSAVVAESWFAANKKQGLLAPFGVGTIDQSLMAVLQTKHVFVRLFGLAGKCVILDEVHAYDAYMTTLLERLLNWLSALGCPVVLLSATLPKDRREKLLKAYAPWDGELPAASYPRITTAGGRQKPQAHPVEADEDRRRVVALDWLAEDQLSTHLGEALNAGGCACVIRNTVGSAQKTCESLREAFATEIRSGELELGLFHARFPFGRRQEIEQKVLATFGKGEGGQPNNPRRPKKAILVATQVVEQSLDLDFDLMVSDVAPADLILQRAGRLWRHARTDRRTAVNAATLWLIQPETKKDIPDFGVSEWVYARYILLRSFLSMHGRSNVALPDDLETLVEQVYGTDELFIPVTWALAMEDAEEAMKGERRGQRMAAKSVTIFDPENEALFEQQNANLQEDDPEAHKKIQAATRDTEPSVQVVLLYHRDGKDYLDPKGGNPIDTSVKPPLWLARRMMENEITLNNKNILFDVITTPVPKGWRESGLFRYHRLVRLDSNGSAVVGKHTLNVDHDLGVRVWKTGKREANSDGEY